MMFKIVQAPDPVLQQVCEPCDIDDPTLRPLAEGMAEAMYANNGCGIAAPQVGIAKRLVVVDVDWDEDDRDPLIMVNPEIVETRGERESCGEGCLSLPGISVPVDRYPWVRARYNDLDGDLWEIEGDGLLARCIQHELDHLEGRTLLESCDPVTRINAIRSYDEARKAGARPGDTSIEER